MTRTATRVAAAVGATVVLMGLATPALACTNTDAGGRSAAVSSDQGKNDPGKAFHTGKHESTLTLAERQAKLDARIANKLAWLEAVKPKVSASTRLGADQKTAVLARIQSTEDALTLLRADVDAATTLDGLRAVLKAADVNLLQRWGWHHGRHHGARHHGGGMGSDQGQRNGGSNHRGGGDRHGSGFHASNHSGGFQH